MLNTFIFKGMLIVCVMTSNLHGLKGLLLCGDLRAAEVYNPDEMVCCNKVLFERFDEDERERDCCSNTLYYTDVYECVNGRLINIYRAYPLSSALNEPIEIEDISALNVPIEKEDIDGNVFTGLLLCGDVDAEKLYSPDKMFCCNKTLFERVDEYKQERDCCSNKLYHTDAYECVNGRLNNINRAYSLFSALNVPIEKEDIDGNVFTGLLLCGDPVAIKEYSPDKMFCCNKTLFERVDEYKQERGCCSNKMYYTDVYECVNGRLNNINRAYSLFSALNVPKEKKDIDGNVFTGLLLCGDPGAIKKYSPDKMFCCNKTLFERVDEYKQERGCCSTTLYYTEVYDCVNGRLININQAYPLSSALNVPKEKEDIVGKEFTVLCGDLDALEVYNPDEMVCCHKTLFERFDGYELERDCCSSTLYFPAFCYCVDGMLMNWDGNPLSTTSKSPMEKEAIDGNSFCIFQ